MQELHEVWLECKLVQIFPLDKSNDPYLLSYILINVTALAAAFPVSAVEHPLEL